MDRKGTKKKELGNKYFLNGTKKGGERVCECVRGCKCVCESERARENERDLDWDGRTTTTTTVQVFCEECFRTGSGPPQDVHFPGIEGTAAVKKDRFWCNTAAAAASCPFTAALLRERLGQSDSFILVQFSW